MPVIMSFDSHLVIPPVVVTAIMSPAARGRRALAGNDTLDLFRCRSISALATRCSKITSNNARRVALLVGLIWRQSDVWYLISPVL